MLKRLKSLFIIEEEVGGPFQPKDDGSVSEGTSENIGTVEEIQLSGDAQPSEKFINSLLKAIEANNLEGFDYLEYKQSLKSLSKMEMDEKTKFNSAYAMAKTMGASKQNLIESANHYLGVLKGEELKFNTAYEKQKQKQVFTRQEKLKNIKSTISKKEEQIKKLQEDIAKAKSDLEAKQKELEVAAAKVGGTKDQFLASFNKVSKQINVDIERMNKYLTT